MHHQFQGGDAHVGLPGLLIVTQIPDVAIASLQVEQIGELGAQAQTGQRRGAVVAVTVAVDVVEVGTAFCEHGEDVVHGQAGDTGQGPPLGLEVDAVDATLAGIEIAQLGGKVFGEVVAAEQGDRGGVLVGIQTEGVQVMAISPTCTHTRVPVISRLGGGSSHGCNSQSNQGWCHFHFHHFILVELPCYGRTAHSLLYRSQMTLHVVMLRFRDLVTDGLNKKWMVTWILMKLFLHGQLTGQ
ncbi:hypothetical protein D3C84_395130 [compost metagenome]